MKTYYKELYEAGFAVDKAHNEYLHIAVTTGVISLIVYVSLIAYILIRLLFKLINLSKSKLHNKTSVLLITISVSLISYLFQASANISTLCVAPFFWCMLGIAAKISCDNKEVFEERG